MMGGAAGPEAAADSKAGWVHDFARQQQQQRGAIGAPAAAAWANDFANMSLVRPCTLNPWNPC